MFFPGSKKTLSRSLAQEIIDCMGENGQPPERGLEFVTVGLNAHLDIIENEYLRRLLGQAGGSAFRLVQGSYGAGKTHFLGCVRSIAQRLGFLTCSVNLSPSECPYEDALSVYKAAASNIALRISPSTQEQSNLGSYVVGFTNILRLAAANQLPFASECNLDDVPVENYTFRRVCKRFISVCRSQDEEEEFVLDRWLSGEAGFDREVLRNFGVFDDIASDNAFPILRSMVSILTSLGFPGVIFLFDEVDMHISSASRRHLQAIGDNLRQLIDLCASSRLPRVMFFYAVPPEFMTINVVSYPALQQRLERPLHMSKFSPQSVVIDLERATEDESRFFTELGQKLTDAAVIAWDWHTFNFEQGQKSLQVFVNFMTDHIFTGGYRLFVKFWIAVLHSWYTNGQNELDEASLSAML
ncbi:MAG: BREX system ATP-binding domain-containing protein [Candidatus Bruticola sp.]